MGAAGSCMLWASWAFTVGCTSVSFGKVWLYAKVGLS